MEVDNKVRYLAEFLGANILDNKPFIVMPFMKNGNALDYIRANTQCDLLRMVGLVFLTCISF